MKPGLRALILGLVFLPAIALCVLGLRAIRSEHADARREAAAEALRIRDGLQDDVARLLDRARSEVEAGTGPALAFRVEVTGRISRPPTRSYPAAARSFSSEILAALRDLLATTDEDLRRGDAASALDVLEPAQDLFEDDDLAAIVRDRTALALEADGQVDRALLLHCRTLESPARDLDGFPLAIPAGLRAAALLRALDRTAEADAIERRVAGLLAENPWSLPEDSRARLRRELPAVPEEPLYDAVRGLVLPEVTRGPPRPEWTVLRGRAAGRDVLVPIRATSSGGAEGAVLLLDEVRSRLLARAAEIARVTGADVALDDVAPPPDTESVSGPLNPPFESLRLRVAVRPSSRGRVLGALWASLSVLLLAALGAGVALGARALRREMRLARLRQDLLDNVSHELRTPLASIRTLAENLEDEAVPEARRPDYFRALNRESRRVARLVEDVLDLSRLERGVAPRREPVDPVALARRAIEELATEPGADDFVVRLEIEGDPPEIPADSDAVRRALLNLLVNAARYSRAVRSADLTVRAGDDIVSIAVRDRGPGIPASERRAIFERFHRVPSDTHDVKGTGLGLPLARAVVQAHGGRLLLDSEPGRGSTFTIEIPVETTT